MGMATLTLGGTVTSQCSFCGSNKGSLRYLPTAGTGECSLMLSLINMVK